MLNLYTDNTFLTEKHRREVFPLLFDIHFLKDKTTLEYYNIVDRVSECDIVVFPIDYVQFLKFKPSFLELQKLAKQNDKPIWIYTAGDYGFTNYIKNSYTFRLGGYNSKLRDSTFVIPSFINDPYKAKLPQGFSALKKETLPSIGFVGHAKRGFQKYVKELSNHLKYRIKRSVGKLLVDLQSFYPSSIKRAQYLSQLQLSTQLNTNFILRDTYRAGVQTEKEKKKTTQEFYDNIFNNAYTFCSRGVGNFSVRFYETLAVGRIPILLDTDCRLPLHKNIKWNTHCVIIDEKTKEPIETQVLKFHNALNGLEFESLQKNNRILWETYLKRNAYFINIHNHFKKEKQNIE